MDERDLELIIMLDKTRNITKAASALYITQSALSKRIQSIEQELGTAIILRSRHGIRFTPAGENVLSHVNKAASTLEQMRISLAAEKDDISGSIYAGFSVNYAQHTLPDILARFNREYPKVKLHITTNLSPVLFDQFMDELDIAVLRGEHSWTGDRFLLSEEKLCLIYNHEFEGRSLSDYPYIHHITDAAQTMMLNRWIREQGVTPPDQDLAMDSLTTCVEMAKRGLGWTIVPEIVLPGYDGVITPLRFSDGEPLVRRTYAFVNPNAMHLPQCKIFLDMLMENR